MNDRLALVIGGVVFSALAWAFWHFFQSDAMNMMLILALFGVSVDNLRLRRRLGARK